MSNINMSRKVNSALYKRSYYSKYREVVSPHSRHTRDLQSTSYLIYLCNSNKSHYSIQLSPLSASRLLLFPGLSAINTLVY